MSSEPFDPASVSVRDNPEQQRFEVYVGDTRAGLADYERNGGTITFTHTEVDSAFEGRGLAGR
ncbi:MAG TPA: N-acetyltransferase, partial [Ilumatobacteraceae bacterium]|nr:N-acetyltransferase [Ilumatobacteraceae bacterium]